MSLEKLKNALSKKLRELQESGTLKGEETVITGVKGPARGFGPRYFIENYPGKEFLRMNANNYLGLALRREVIKAEEKAASVFGSGPGAVRFISGTFRPHIDLEQRLARFHLKEASVLFSSAYAAVMGTLTSLISDDTIVISDELNHNCIINAIRTARPKDKKIYKHNCMDDLEKIITDCVGACRRIVITTDGVFSMRGDHAPLPNVAGLQARYESSFEEGIVTVVDDSHGVGALGDTGRGTMEHTGEQRIDILIATLGKALGVNGGYAVSDETVISYLRETSPFYIYSNPITPSEASAALTALEILDSTEGQKMLKQLHKTTSRFERGVQALGYEIIPSAHPIVPLMIRNSRRTAELVHYLKDHGILATGINFPVVPKGDEAIRFQICADHTETDIDYVLGVLKAFKETEGKG
jgi:glycine C-acetyltransferase